MENRTGKAGIYILLLLIGLIAGAIGGIEVSKHIAKLRHTQQQYMQQQSATGNTASDNAEELQEPLYISRENAIVRAARLVSPGVVGIVVTQTQLERHGFGNDEFFDFFFGPELAPRVKEVERMGSGFVFSKDGYILTNYHVVDGAQKLYITFPDGKQVEGHIVGVDPQTDLAVLSTPGVKYPCVKLGNSDTLLIGEWAIAIGNPFGFFINDAHPSVTLGVISAANRNFAPSEGVYYQGMIQTDASINQGNSGGPLVNAAGEVIGINTFIFTGSDNNRGSIGIGFAIPINRAKRVVQEIMTQGKRRTIYTGITVQDITKSIAQAVGYDHADGVIISDVQKGSPGESAGLIRGDIIVIMGNRRIHASSDIEGLFLDYFVGDPVAVTYVRNGKLEHTRITLKEFRG
jgi:serine protease Do